MLDDWQEVFALALIQLGLDANTTNTAEMDQALALLEQQKPLVRVYSTDTTTTMSSGDNWIGQIWGADIYKIQEENENMVYYIPEEGGVRGSDTMAIFSGAKHPIAAHLFVNHMLDAQISAAEHELHLLHGPERRGQGVHRPGDPRGPDREPRRGARRQAPGTPRPRTGRPRRVPDEVADPSWLRPARSRHHHRTPPRPGRPARAARSATALASAVLVLPGVVWLAILFVVPLAMMFVVSLGSRGRHSTR